MGRKKISTTIYITPEQDEQLKLLHARTRVPVAEYIRQGIDQVLEQYRDVISGQLSLYDRLARPAPAPALAVREVAPSAVAEPAPAPLAERPPAARSAPAAAGAEAPPAAATAPPAAGPRVARERAAQGKSRR